MKRLLIALAIIIAAASWFFTSKQAAQSANKVYVRHSTGAPSTCPVGTLYVDDATGFTYVNKAGSCFLSGTGGSGTVTVVGAGSLTSTALVTGGGSQSLQTPSATSTLDASGNLAHPGTLRMTANGALSSGAGSALQANGTWVTGGSATTTKPYFLIETTGATSAAWDVSGTGVGVNAATGFTGKLIDLQTNGVPLFSVAGNGNVSAAGSVLGAGLVRGATFGTATNCADSAGAAACGSAAAGSFVIDAATTSVVVSTTAVTANSNIFVGEDASLGTRLSVTCNTQSSLVLGTPRVTARTAGTSFTVTIDLGPTTNPMCLGFHLTN